jgi:hypothetical protein
MKPELEFSLENVITVEFGVGCNDGSGEESFVVIPVDRSVQEVLRQMAITTWEIMSRHEDAPTKYEPSESYGSAQYVYFPLHEELAAGIRHLHEAVDLRIDATALSNPVGISSYFARMTDKENRRLTALRRAIQFKGILKSKNRLVRLVDDTLTIVTDTVFKLDNDFDLLVDAANVHILRPSCFEFVAKLQHVVQEAVPKNIAIMRTDMPFVNFDTIEKYARVHSRAARYLASIRSLGETKNIDKVALKKLCKKTGVEIKEVRGKIEVVDGHILGFLEVLDRRRYQVELVKGRPERFKADSRRKLDT